MHSSAKISYGPELKKHSFRFICRYKTSIFSPWFCQFIRKISGGLSLGMWIRTESTSSRFCFFSSSIACFGSYPGVVFRQLNHKFTAAVTINESKLVVMSYNIFPCCFRANYCSQIRLNILKSFTIMLRSSCCS